MLCIPFRKSATPSPNARFGVTGAVMSRSHIPACARLNLWRSDLDDSVSGRASAELHGLRGVAVLMVIASHTNAFGLQGIGGVGVWVFFVLSGYLLAPYFIDRPLTIRRIGRFIKRRLLRIMPAFCVAVVALYASGDAHPLKYALMNVSMLAGDYHLWSVKQELALYVVLPLMFLLPARGMAFAVCLVLAGVVIHLLVGPDVFSLRGASKDLRFYALPFFLGVSAAVFVRSASFTRLQHHRLCGAACDVVTIAFGIAVVLASQPLMKRGLGWDHYEFYSVGAALVLLAVVLQRGRLTGAVFTSRPLIACGVVGYSLYLVHPFVIARAEAFGINAGITLFAVACLGSFALAAFMYGYVERVFWKPHYAEKGTTTQF